MEIKRKQPLGIELVRRGVVNGDAIEKALQYQTEHPNRRLGDILYILKEAEPNELAEEIGDIIGVKGIYLTDGKIKIEQKNLISQKRPITEEETDKIKAILKTNKYIS